MNVVVDPWFTVREDGETVPFAPTLVETRYVLIINVAVTVQLAVIAPVV